MPEPQPAPFTRGSTPATPVADLRVVAFVEHFLRREHTFVDRQTRSLPGVEVRYLARFRVPGHPYPEDNVHFFGPPRVPRWWSLWRRPERLLGRVTGSYKLLLPWEKRRLRALLSEWRPHLIHAHWAEDATLVHELAAELKIPLVVHFYGYDASRLARDPLFVSCVPRLFDSMALALTVSEDLRARVIRLGCDAHRVRCHYTGVPDEWFLTPRSIPPAGKGPVFLFVGRLAPKKGHRAAISAFKLVRDRIPEARLVLIGDGTLRSQIEAQVQSLDLSSGVDILGYRGPAVVRAMLREAHALLVPSETAPDGDVEGFPNVAAEGLAASLPIVATSHAGIPELVAYSEKGWLVSEGDVEGLADRMLRLARDLSLWSRLGAEGYALARARLHLPTQNAALVTLYREILAESADRA
jgi:colanic acid/amylovoran biosynthesis glycosyltransferase